MEVCVVSGGQGLGAEGRVTPMLSQEQKALPGPPSCAQPGMTARMLSTAEDEAGMVTPMREKPLMLGSPHAPFTPMLVAAWMVRRTYRWPPWKA